jgi:hypothetical protein
LHHAYLPHPFSFLTRIRGNFENCQQSAEHLEMPDGEKKNDDEINERIKE